jgi:hypothetical protein
MVEQRLDRPRLHLYQVSRDRARIVFDSWMADPFGRLWYAEPNAISNAVGYAQFYSRSHDAVIRVFDAAGNVIQTHEHKGDFKEW